MCSLIRERVRWSRIVRIQYPCKSNYPYRVEFNSSRSSTGTMAAEQKRKDCKGKRREVDLKWLNRKRKRHPILRPLTLFPFFRFSFSLSSSSPFPPSITLTISSFTLLRCCSILFATATNSNLCKIFHRDWNIYVLIKNISRVFLILRSMFLNEVKKLVYS